MKTKEFLAKYTRLINALVGSKECKIFVVDNGKWKEIGEQYHIDDDIDKPTIERNWSVGHYRLDIDNTIWAASWRLYQMPHCCAICVSCESSVKPAFRGKGLGTLLNTMRKEISTMLGYSLLLCTDIEANTPQRKILATNGWKDIYSVLNRRTNNVVHISVVNT